MRPPGDFLVDVADGDDPLDVIVHLLVGEHREHMAVLALGLKFIIGALASSENLIQKSVHVLFCLGLTKCLYEVTIWISFDVSIASLSGLLGVFREETLRRHPEKVHFSTRTEPAMSFGTELSIFFSYLCAPKPYPKQRVRS